jgi:PAS domain S-box-containing protein
LTGLDDVWRSLLGRACDGSFVLDRELRITWLDDGMARLLRGAAGDLHGRDLTTLATDPAHAREVLQGQRERRSAVALRALDGTAITLEITTHHDATRIAGVARDLTEQVAVKHRLERSEASFRALIERMPDAIAVHRAGKLVYANSALASQLGWDSAEALIGTSLIALVHPEDHEKTRERIRRLGNAGDTVPFAEARLLRKDGSVVHAWVGAVTVVFDGEPSIAAIGRDMTEQRQLQAQIAFTDRLTSLGTLAAGVAHEINNPLTYVMLSLDVIATRNQRIRDALETGAPTLASLDEIDGAVTRALSGSKRVAGIVNDLTRFARIDEEHRSHVHLGKALELAISMATHEIRRVRELVVDAEPNLPPVQGNEGRFAQVFLNLIINAVQSSPEPASNAIRIELRNTGTHVRVSVRDRGTGIAAEHLPRLFDPFFTTKPVGHGTGLGLSVCHGIVTALGGTITVDSKVGTGSTFTVDIPIPEQPVETADAKRSSPNHQLPRRRILVIDDEEAITRAIAAALADTDNVVAVSSLSAAREAIDADPTFDMVLCDVVMGPEDGRLLAPWLAANHPELVDRLVLMSGGVADSAAAGGEPLPRVLVKPFTTRDLLRSLHAIAGG